MEDQDQIKEIYMRKAELRNDEITVRTYIPPNYYNRFTYLNQICKEAGGKDNTLKTQLRFGQKDIEIFVKYKGENAPFRMVKIEDFTDPKLVPKFDHSIKWKIFEDKPPRRKLVRSPENPAKGNPTERLKTNSMRRQHSTSSNETEKKKTKLSNK